MKINISIIFFWIFFLYSNLFSDVRPLSDIDVPLTYFIIRNNNETDLKTTKDHIQTILQKNDEVIVDNAFDMARCNGDYIIIYNAGETSTQHTLVINFKELLRSKNAEKFILPVVTFSKNESGNPVIKVDKTQLRIIKNNKNKNLDDILRENKTITLDEIPFIFGNSNPLKEAIGYAINEKKQGLLFHWLKLDGAIELLCDTDMQRFIKDRINRESYQLLILQLQNYQRAQNELEIRTQFAQDFSKLIIEG